MPNPSCFCSVFSLGTSTTNQAVEIPRVCLRKAGEMCACRTVLSVTRCLSQELHRLPAPGEKSSRNLQSMEHPV